MFTQPQNRFALVRSLSAAVLLALSAGYAPPLAYGRGAVAIAAEGEQPGGMAAGLIYSKLFTPLLNNAGVVAYRGDVSTAARMFVDTGVWTGNDASPAPVYLDSAGAATGSGYASDAISMFTWPFLGLDESGGVVNTWNDVASTAFVEQGSSFVASSGEAPGFAGSFLLDIAASGVNAAGSVVAHGFFAPDMFSPPSNALWVGPVGSLSPVIVDGMAVSNLPGVELMPYAFDAAGAEMGGGSTTPCVTGAVLTTGQNAIVTTAAGSLTSIVKYGDVAPEYVAGSTFMAPDVGGTGPQHRSINSAGHVVFIAGVNDFDSLDTHPGAVWLWNGSTLRYVVRMNDPAPLLGGTFHTLGNCVINEDDHVAFQSMINVGGDPIDGIFFGHRGAIELVAYDGQPAPGLPGKILVFNGGPAYAGYVKWTLNNNGQVALYVAISDGPDVAADDTAIYVWIPGSGLALVAAEGLPVGDDPRIVTNLFAALGGHDYASSTDDASPTAFNDYGEVAFLAYYAECVPTPPPPPPLPPGPPCTPVFNSVVYLYGGTIEPCDGDADGDGDRDFNDIISVLANWGSAGPGGDADHNGFVNFNDVIAVLSVYGAPCG